MNGWGRARVVWAHAVGVGGGAWGQGEVAGLAEVLQGGRGLRDAGERSRVVAAMRGIEGERRRAARREVGMRGLPERARLGGGRLMELVDWRDGVPVYVVTSNVNAAISTGADHLAGGAFGLTGSGVAVGVWDGGGVRASHQEFGGRVEIMDGAGAIDHATHVAGTLAATGVTAGARGMATALAVDSYDWDNDISEMTARGAAVAGEAGKIYLSNHSYNYVGGWNYVGQSGRQWEWYGAGTGAGAVEDDFGRYNTFARDTDSLAYNAPYYLMVRSAGNDRIDVPTTGQMVALSPGGEVVAYDPAGHPKGDGVYRGGFETIGFNALAKNVLTVGSVADAVSGGQRALGRASMSGFSSWGPTDDGRIKPDVVANGEWVYSASSGGDAAYINSSGTSMSAPNATGSAALLIELYGRLFPGQAMRASTLKGLLIHTADDLGNPGPDYKFGWGLVNVAAAAGLVQGSHDVPDRPAVIERALSTSVTSRAHLFAWDGVSPIRATLCWTDPAGSSTTTSDSRTPRLINNLNLKLIGPGGGEHLPYVMPYVGTWTQASMDLPAATGVNVTDSVEQVVLAAPTVAGMYQAVVTFAGTLTNGAQNYSLILSGTTASGPLPPEVAAVTPEAAESGVVELSISGSSFSVGAAVNLTLPGQADVPVEVMQVSSTVISARLDVTGLASGLWNLRVTNPDGQSGILPAAFGVVDTLWSQNFDTGSLNWSTNASVGTTNWALTTLQSHTPTSSWFASGPATRNTDNLVSEPIAIPMQASRLQFSFWHWYSLESGNDGGVLEFSIDGGAWFQVTNAGTAEAIIEGGYPVVLNSGGNPSTRNPLAGRPAWSGNAGSTFTQVVVALVDTAKYAGKSLSARWRLGTNSSVASPDGWYVDSARMTGVGGVTNQPPSVVTEATAAPLTVTSDSVALSVTATDDGGEGALSYTWTATGGSIDRPVTFTENGDNEAKATVATFTMAGNYSFQVIVRDAAGLTSTSTVDVAVEPSVHQVSVMPAVASVVYGATQTFTALVQDQFGDVISTPVQIVWSSEGGGYVDTEGVFAAQVVGGPFAVSASSDLVLGTAAVTVTPAPALVTLGQLNQTYDGSPREVEVTTVPADLAVEVEYDGNAEPPSAHGTYAVSAVVSDPNYVASATGVLTITGQPIAEWKTQQFSEEQTMAGLAADDADPDQDGLTNLTEYGLGGDPWTATPMVGGGLDDDGLALTFTRPKALPDVEYLAEASSDLVSWVALPLMVISDGPIQTVRAVDPSATAADRRFLQLRVVRAGAGE
ncbi:MAG: S8 family serine peptidase [Verrucomicrobiales bacterium]